MDPADDAFVDTTEGGFWFDLTQAPALEIDRLWDFLGTEVPMVMFPPYAYGGYLDEWGVTLNVARKPSARATGTVRFTGDEGTFVATNAQVSTPQLDPDSDPVTYETTASGVIPAGGILDLPVQALLAGSAGNQAGGAVSVLDSPVAGVSAVTNLDAITGGADVEGDEAYRDRLLLEFSSTQGGGTVTDYKRWALAYPGVGYATVEPLWAGNGTVRVIVTDQDNNPASGTVTSGLQVQLDPVAGQGLGLAPIGAAVTVATPTLLTVNVAAALSLLSGYTLDGTGGTTAVRDDIGEAIRAYVDQLDPGDDVVLEHVKARLFSVLGVYDVSGVTLNGIAANVAVGALQVARTGTVTLA